MDEPWTPHEREKGLDESRSPLSSASRCLEAFRLSLQGRGSTPLVLAPAGGHRHSSGIPTSPSLLPLPTPYAPVQLTNPSFAPSFASRSNASFAPGLGSLDTTQVFGFLEDLSLPRNLRPSRQELALLPRSHRPSRQASSLALPCPLSPIPYFLRSPLLGPHPYPDRIATDQACEPGGLDCPLPQECCWGLPTPLLKHSQIG